MPYSYGGRQKRVRRGNYENERRPINSGEVEGLEQEVEAMVAQVIQNQLKRQVSIKRI